MATALAASCKAVVPNQKSVYDVNQLVNYSYNHHKPSYHQLENREPSGGMLMAGLVLKGCEREVPGNGSQYVGNTLVNSL